MAGPVLLIRRCLVVLVLSVVVYKIVLDIVFFNVSVHVQKHNHVSGRDTIFICHAVAVPLINDRVSVRACLRDVKLLSVVYVQLYNFMIRLFGLFIFCYCRINAYCYSGKFSCFVLYRLITIYPFGVL